MKAMVLTGIREMEMREAPDPVLKADDDVLIRMGVVGVCGSDVHYYKTGRIGSQVVQYPYAVGHEGAGIVEKVGPAVTRVQPGDRIAIEPAMSCWTCDQCQAGRHHTCRSLRFLGCPGQADGCLAEYLVMPEACCFPIAANMTLEQAAVSEPLAIGVYAVRQSIPMEGTRIGILGAGPIGLSVLMPALARGCERVYMTDKIDDRLKVAQANGAHWIGNPDKDNVVSEILKAEPGALDVVFECCGEQEALDQAIEILKPGGKLMLIGIPTVDRISFSIDLLRRKEICIQNVRRQCDCVDEALELIRTGSVKAEGMVTHRFAFEQSKEAFDLVSEYQDGVVKAMIHFDGAEA